MRCSCFKALIAIFLLACLGACSSDDSGGAGVIPGNNSADPSSDAISASDTTGASDARDDDSSEGERDARGEQDTDEETPDGQDQDDTSDPGGESDGGSDPAPSTYCGNGIIEPGEECDDGNSRDGDGCSADCKIEPGYKCPEEGKICVAAGCGDGIVAGAEQCDDGNNVSGDGCSADCKVEVGWECPNPGEPCEFAVVCGDGKIEGLELCDDGNTEPGDGCDENCQLEPGWRCPIPGEPCEPARCGDGIIAGHEQCDDGNNEPGDGCNELCQLEPGWVCPTPGEPCVPTVCGDGIREGSEACDDGNNDLGDGCTPFCDLEPNCPADGGPCTSSCGDGIRLPNSPKECEDGNTFANDGCSPTCTIEPGWVCDDITHEIDELELPLVLRDFSIEHPDFETFSGSGPTTGIVEDRLGADGKPVFKAAKGQVTSQATFDQWYRDVSGVNIPFVDTLVLTETFEFNSSFFFPLDGRGYGDEGMKDENGELRNFAFTSEVRYWFVYRPGQVLRFTGDDDLWVFINKRLALDLGGLHSAESGEVDLDAEKQALGLEDDKLYEIAVFHAERHTTASKYHLTLGNFVNVTSECRSICGDGIKTSVEECDDGVNDGSYGGCNPDCTRASYCGDGTVDDEFEQEQCDNGVNQDLYGEDGCNPLCRRPAFCGDYRVDSLFGEECDDGINDGSYGGCNPDCTLAPRCGDGILQPEFGEECDDGNQLDGDGCSSDCKLE